MKDALEKALLIAMGANGALILVGLNNGDVGGTRKVVVGALLALVMIYVVLGISKQILKKRAHG